MSVYYKENFDKDGKTISFRFAVPRGKDSDTGKPLYHWETIKTDCKRVLNKRIREVQGEIDRGIYVKPAKQSLKDYLECWLRDSALPALSPRGFEGYEYCCLKYIFPALGRIPLSELKPAHIQHLISEQQIEGHFRTAKYVYSTLKKALNAAVKMGILHRNPCDAIESPKVPAHEMKVMSKSDYNNFLEYIQDSPYYALFYTALFTGMRRSELLALEWKSVDLLLCLVSINRTMHVPTTGRYQGQIIFKQPKTATSRRPIDLTPSNAIVLRQHREAQNKIRISSGLPELKEDDLVFCNFDGRPYLPDSLSNAWAKLAARAGLKGIRFHDSRHSMATIMLKDGIHPKIVQDRLGHADIGTTLNTYSHVVPGLQKAAALKFDDVLQPKANKLDKELKELILN
jgi:integrase